MVTPWSEHALTLDHRVLGNGSEGAPEHSHTAFPGSFSRFDDARTACLDAYDHESVATFIGQTTFTPHPLHTADKKLGCSQGQAAHTSPHMCPVLDSPTVGAIRHIIQGVQNFTQPSPLGASDRPLGGAQNSREFLPGASVFFAGVDHKSRPETRFGGQS